MFNNLNWVEIAGYAASIIVAVSLMMSSIVKLRWYNLIGASVFSVYGFIIKAYPVGFLNAFIAAADIYYLFAMYRKNEYFRVQHVNSVTDYLHYFLQFYENDILKYFPDFKLKNDKQFVYFYILRNVSIAGVVAGKMDTDGYFRIHLDYAAPEYRDLKLGKFFFRNPHEFFVKMKIKGFIARSHNDEHAKYLEKMKFSLIKKTADYKDYKLVIR
ncbi:MAG: hypothetical protein JW982_05635 [Spirochaetes bacterium]|nr:hypothetical protein [Spirochaetota bacterium]